MSKPNYSFEKRRRELAKKKKKEEKSQNKLAKRPASDAATAESSPDASPPVDVDTSIEKT